MFDSASKKATSSASPARRFFLASAVSTLSLAVVAPVAVPATVPTAAAAVPQASSTAGPWLDTSDRAAVIASYNAEFSKAPVDPGWTGNRESCNAGTTSQAYRDSIIDRVNWFRSMAGVPAIITENLAMSAMAQESALTMSESGRLSHSPDSSYLCVTPDGAAASGKSNLYLGRTGPDAITGYVQDPGSNNASVGHRNWILHPTSTELGTGDIPGDGGWASNTLFVIEDASIVFGPQPELREQAGFVAWPNAGYVPSEVVYDRWSVGLRNADFGSANVTMSVGGQSIPVNIEYRSGGGNGAPFPIMVWNAPSLDTTPAFDTVVTVSVNNVGTGGGVTSFSYETIIIGQELPRTFDAYITQAFQDFLGRSPSESEFNQWRARLNSGTSRLDFVNTLATSTEWTTVVVQNLYQDTLGRSADPAGAIYWADRLRTGTSVAAAASQFYGSPEYVSAEGGSWSEWLTDLYLELMNRNPDGSGLGFWVRQAEVRGSGDVAYDFYQSDESRRARVRSLYVKFLGRGPDSGGLAYWAEVLNSGDDLALAAYLASSEEYFNKAG